MGAQGVAGINRNGWPTSIGIGGRLAAECAYMDLGKDKLDQARPAATASWAYFVQARLGKDLSSTNG